jgi:hypothetical protein
MTKPSKRRTVKGRKKRLDSGSARQLRTKVKSSPASSDIADHETSSAPASAKKTNVLRLSLKEFVKRAWRILEPVSPLVWNWHLDLICEYLTLVRNEKFKKSLWRS